MKDNLIGATNTLRTSVSTLKKKLSNLKVEVEMFGAELESIDAKFDNLVVQSEIYKSKLERELGREVRRLERELSQLRKKIPTDLPAPANSNEIKIASTIGVFDSILRHMCKDAEDFRLGSEAFLFPAVYERVASASIDAYFLEEVPPSANVVIDRGREHLNWLRTEYYSHLTNPSTWESAIEYIVEWWRNDALPMIYGARDEQWDIDLPLSLQEMMVWRDSPADRPLQFSAIFDAFEIYQKHKDAVYVSAGIRDFEKQRFALDS